jgi:hypothetical protein
MSHIADVRQKELGDWYTENERNAFLKKVEKEKAEYHSKIKNLEGQLKGLRDIGEPTEFTVKTVKQEELERRAQEEYENRAY